PPFSFPTTIICAMPVPHPFGVLRDTISCGTRYGKRNRCLKADDSAIRSALNNKMTVETENAAPKQERRF
ncbi:MAG: hypothetical protein ABJ349_10680, partial [Hyphomicrobiales bacterium]